MDAVELDAFDARCVEAWRGMRVRAQYLEEKRAQIEEDVACMRFHLSRRVDDLRAYRVACDALQHKGDALMTLGDAMARTMEMEHALHYEIERHTRLLRKVEVQHALAVARGEALDRAYGFSTAGEKNKMVL